MGGYICLNRCTRRLRAAEQRQPRAAEQRADAAGIPARLARLPAAAGGDAATDTALTAAEREVLQLMAIGLDNRNIALRLGKSEKTVRNQVSSVFDKLGVRTRAEAIVWVHGQHRDRSAGA